MKLKTMLMTSVILASIGTSSVAYAGTPAIRTSPVSSKRSNEQVQNVQMEFLNEVASIVELDPRALINYLKSGKTISEIANEAGISKSYLVSNLVAKEKQSLDQEVEKGTLSLEQESLILYKATAQLSTLVDQAMPLKNWLDL